LETETRASTNPNISDDVYESIEAPVLLPPGAIRGRRGGGRSRGRPIVVKAIINNPDSFGVGAGGRGYSSKLT